MQVGHELHHDTIRILHYRISDACNSRIRIRVSMVSILLQIFELDGLLIQRMRTLIRIYYD